MFDHNIFPVLLDLRFELDAHNLRTAVLYLTYNVSENLWSDFIALCFLSETYV